MFKLRERLGIRQDGVVAIGDATQDGDNRIHVCGHLPADRIATPFRIEPGPAAAVRRTGLSAGNANRDAMVSAWRPRDYALDTHFDLPSGREVVLIEEALCGTEPEL